MLSGIGPKADLKALGVRFEQKKSSLHCLFTIKLIIYIYEEKIFCSNIIDSCCIRFAGWI